MRKARQLRTEWWRHLIPKIGRCRSTMMGVPCDFRRWHLGWHESGDIGWQRRCTTRRDQ